MLLDEQQAEEIKKNSLSFKSITLTRRQLCDLELLLNGGFAPLQGFMNQADYDSVLDNMKLSHGAFWPMPITLDIPAQLADQLEIGERLALRDAEGFMPAVLKVEEKWTPDRQREARLVYGTDSDKHPGVQYLLRDVHDVYISGQLEGIQLPQHYDFETLWDTPEELRTMFKRMGWRQVMAFHTSNPIHRLHREMILNAAKENEAHILLHPAVGVTKPGDLHYYARVHCYKAVRNHFPHNLATLSLLPLAMRMAGPREALWHALVNRNYGCSHFIVGPHHASPPDNNGAQTFYEEFAAQQLAQQYEQQLGIKIVATDEWRYVDSKKQFMPLQQIKKQNLDSQTYSTVELKKALAENQDIPEWFSYPAVINELRKVYPPRNQQGFTLFFTGLSGSGKSTIAGILFAKLVEAGGRPVSLLDGDIVRQNLSSELGFSKAHRDLNIRRIGFVASEITKNGGVAICAPIAPYADTRAAVRELIEQGGAFIEIHVATPLEVCEARDRKGLYAKARKGIIPEFTGISDPYDVPEKPEMRIDTTQVSAAEAVQDVLLYLLKNGYIDE
ncbi:MAG: bifunctional sulfate adenylyltransferase/adenylylsulfate kinase [Chromatiales bacterium]|jgi:sulfate adenylyltransferase